jgi:hypothetical protein
MPGENHPFAEAIRTISAPFILPITAPYFATYEGFNFTLTQDAIWTKPLGKDMCILDVDNRPFSDKNQLFDEKNAFRWGSLDNFSAAFLNHYLYGILAHCHYILCRASELTRT